MEQHSGVWSLAVSAVAWSLPQLYPESGVLHRSGTLDKCLGTPDGKWGLSPGTICGWSRSADVDVLVTCAGNVGVSPYQMCLE